MMKVLVTYRSVTGNTEKVAEAIYGEIETEKEIKPFKEVESLADYDFVFVGYPVEGWGPSAASKKWLQKFVKKKKIAIFCTHGSPENVPPLIPWLDAMKASATDAGAEVVAFFNCQGEMSQQVIDMMLKSENEMARKFGSMGRDTTIGQPDETRLEAARSFARETMKNI
ncbi:MAG: flavodoxin family protein [Candidatus Bathyarchaeota archaeon]|nr:flavodoxin family protein [Candidatus Bathyarchaeota archaeon]